MLKSTMILLQQCWALDKITTDEATYLICGLTHEEAETLLKEYGYTLITVTSSLWGSVGITITKGHIVAIRNDIGIIIEVKNIINA